MGKNSQINILETEYEHKLEAQKNAYELQIEEMKLDRVVLEVDSGLKSVLIGGLCEELLKDPDPDRRILAERVRYYAALQFGEPSEEAAGFNVLEVMDSVVAERRVEADTGGITLRCLIRGIRDTKVCLPRVYFRELLRILVAESLRCTSEGDSVMLTGEQIQKEGADPDTVSYCFSVRDTGKQGLPSSDTAYFAPFGQMRKEQSTAARVELAIAERLAQLLNGELSMAASGESGMTVSFTVSGKKA